MALGTIEEVREAVKLRAGKIESEKLSPPVDVIEQAIRGALQEYSRLRPLFETFEWAGDGSTRRYLLEDKVSGWANGSDSVSEIYLVTGAGTDDEKAARLDDSEWWVIRDTQGRDVLFLSSAASASEIVRVVAARTHRIAETGDEKTTIPLRDEEAFLTVADWLVAEWMARSASDLVDADLGAEEVDYRSVAESWAARAREARKAFREMLAPDDGGAGVAGAYSLEWNSTSSLSGEDRVGH